MRILGFEIIWIGFRPNWQKVALKTERKIEAIKAYREEYRKVISEPDGEKVVQPSLVDSKKMIDKYFAKHNIGIN